MDCLCKPYQQETGIYRCCLLISPACHMDQLSHVRVRDLTHLWMKFIMLGLIASTMDNGQSWTNPSLWELNVNTCSAQWIFVMNMLDIRVYWTIVLIAKYIVAAASTLIYREHTQLAAALVVTKHETLYEGGVTFYNQIPGIGCSQSYLCLNLKYQFVFGGLPMKFLLLCEWGIGINEAPFLALPSRVFLHPCFDGAWWL